jgi:hypothetical protein
MVIAWRPRLFACFKPAGRFRFKWLPNAAWYCRDKAVRLGFMTLADFTSESIDTFLRFIR